MRGEMERGTGAAAVASREAAVAAGSSREAAGKEEGTPGAGRDPKGGRPGTGTAMRAAVQAQAVGGF